MQGEFEIHHSKQLRAVKKSNRNQIVKRQNLFGWLFVSPWILGLILFYVYPIVSSFYFSLTSYSILSPGRFIGFQNYLELIDDKTFWNAIYNTLYFVIYFVPLSIICSVCLAMLLNVKIKGMAIYRTIYFLPTLVPHVAVAIVWMWLLNPEFGLINSMLDLIGIDGPGWLGSVEWSKPSLILMSLWGIGNAVVIYLAGLNDISKEYYEAAEVDGANWFQKIFYITLPLLTPVIFYNLVMGLINSFQQFALPYALTNGQGTPAGSLMFYVMHVYDNAFNYLKMGYASAMAWVLFIIIMFFTALILWTSKKWVYYQGE